MRALENPVAWYGPKQTSTASRLLGARRERPKIAPLILSGMNCEDHGGGGGGGEEEEEEEEEK